MAAVTIDYGQMDAVELAVPTQANKILWEEEIEDLGNTGNGGCVFTRRLVQKYRPNKKIPWSKELLQRHPWTQQFLHPTVENEFLKFGYRDAMSPVVAFGYSFVCWSWPFMFGSFNWWAGWAFFFGGLIMLGLSIVLFVFHFYLSAPKFTTKVAKGKMWIATVFAVLSANLVAIAPEFVARGCVDIRAAYMADAAANNGTTTLEEPYSPHCTDRVSSSFLFATVGVTLFMRLRTVHGIVANGAAFLVWVIVYFGLTGTGASEDVLDWEKSFIKTLVLLCGVISSALMGARKDMCTRDQFEGNLLALVTTRALAIEKTSTHSVVNALLPHSVICRMVDGDKIEDPEREATVFFSDVKGFTSWSQSRSPAEVVQLVSILCVKFDAICQQYECEKVKTIGDAYWCVSGLPTFSYDHAKNILEFALAAVDCVYESNKQHPEWCNVEIRAGVHTGPVSGGILGGQQLSYEIFGDTNSIANTVEAEGVPSAVCCTAETRDSADMDDLTFIPHKTIESRGGTWDLFVVQTKNHQSGAQGGQQRLLRQKMEKEKAAAVPGLLALPGSTQDTQSGGGGGRQSSGGATRTPRGSQKSAGPQNTNDQNNLDALVKQRARDRRNSQISQTTGQSIDELRAITNKFLKTRKTRLAADEADQAGDDEVMDEEEKVSWRVDRETTKKYACCLYTFADNDAEEGYQKFALKHLRSLRVGGSMCFTSFCLVLVLAQLVDTNNHGLNVVALILSILSVICAGVGGLASMGKLPPMVAPFVGGIGVTLFIVAVGLVKQPDTAEAVGRYEAGNVLANDPGWMTIVFVVLYGFTMSWLSWPLIIGFQVLFLGIPVVVMYLDSSSFGGILFNFGTLTGISIPIAVVWEQSMRQQYADTRTFQLQMIQVEEEQQQLVELISQTIPSFIAPAVRKWITAGQDLSNPLSVQYERLAISFIKFDPPTLIENDAPLPTDSLSQVSGHRSTSSLTNGNAPPLPGHDFTPAPGAPAPLTWGYMCQVQEAIEVQLDKLRCVVKIKTIGNITLLAGPVDPKHAKDEVVLQRAAAELVSLSLNLRRIDTLGNIRSGLHVGSVQGVILGIERMTYDILGAAVNRTARCMTAKDGRSSDVLASKDFVKCYNKWRDEQLFGANVALSEGERGAGADRKRGPRSRVPCAGSHRGSIQSIKSLTKSVTSRKGHRGAASRGGRTPSSPAQGFSIAGGRTPKALAIDHSTSNQQSAQQDEVAILVEMPSGVKSPAQGAISPSNDGLTKDPRGYGNHWKTPEAAGLDSTSANNGGPLSLETGEKAEKIKSGNGSAPTSGKASSRQPSEDSQRRQSSGDSVKKKDTTTPESTSTSDTNSNGSLFDEELEHSEFEEAFEENLKGIGIVMLYRVKDMQETGQERRSREASSSSRNSSMCLESDDHTRTKSM